MSGGNPYRVEAIRPSPHPLADDDVWTPVGYWPAPDPTSPYFCHGPTLVSFSGGRTSAYMLHQVLCAHGGILPGYVIVAFANTGRELEETLRFVHECSVRWGVYIHWVEWRPPASKRAKIEYPEHLRASRKLDKEERAQRAAERKRIRDITEAGSRFEHVSFNSADREGRWFAELIRRKRYLPNQDMRYCTEKLKVDTMKWLMVSLGYATWFNMVGLRADERHRVLKQILRNESGLERFISGCPMALAGITKLVIWRFWLGRNIDPKRLSHPLPQSFDLGLWPWEGNCDLCFLKGRGNKAAMIRARPLVALWWAAQEAIATKLTEVRSRYAKRFDKRESIDALVRAVETSPEIDFTEEDERDAECGVSCIANDTDEPIDEEAWRWMLGQLEKARMTPISMPMAPAKSGDIRDLFGEAA
ncbi:MAG: hypothetical protein DI547_05130 [Sphingobium sp.]|nr:MAG: hypothetical protein DI547_05130 [Sphingobium sp.]